jgi:hypothetical protein
MEAGLHISKHSRNHLLVEGMVIEEHFLLEVWEKCSKKQ